MSYAQTSRITPQPHSARASRSSPAPRGRGQSWRYPMENRAPDQHASRNIEGFSTRCLVGLYQICRCYRLERRKGTFPDGCRIQFRM